MKKYFGYIRVSTVKQGEHGVSLQEQRGAIERYAQKFNLEIVEWFEEQETASKRGRPVWSKMLKLLRANKAAGAIIHKIDRSARNLRDWADLGEMIDSGIDIHFANEGLDLNSRGGRLSADIQAVVASDFIRNLREETRKGMYGRMKQGLFPMPAPLGYLDGGPGKRKIPDPVTAPLIRRLFEFYASGKHGMNDLVDRMYTLGLRTKSGKKLVLSTLSRVLENPFYMGLIRLKRSGETFQGSHEPLVPASLFEQARKVAFGRFHRKGLKHDFMFRRLLRCAYCDSTLIGEQQKGHVYYRCHTSDCGTKSVRHEDIHDSVLTTLKPLAFTEEERAYLKTAVQELRQRWEHEKQDLGAAVLKSEAQISDRLNRLTDAYVDGLLEKELFEQRKNALLTERQKLKQLASTPATISNLPSTLDKFLELAGSAYLTYESGLPDEKREVLEIVTSNRLVRGKTPMFTLNHPFQEVANRPRNPSGVPVQNIARTWKGLLDKLTVLLQNKPITLSRHRVDAA